MSHTQSEARFIALNEKYDRILRSMDELSRQVVELRKEIQRTPLPVTLVSHSCDHVQEML